MGGDVVIGRSIYGVVVIGGSLYSRFYSTCIRQHVSLPGTFVKAQTAALLHTESAAIHLQFMNVQTQGGYECGLFAVAFATMLAIGEPPGRYHFTSSRENVSPSILREGSELNIC